MVKWLPKSRASGDIFVSNIANYVEYYYPGRIKSIDAELTNIDLMSRTDIDIDFDGKYWIEIKEGKKIDQWQVQKQLKASADEGMDYIYYTGGKLGKQQKQKLIEWGVKPENIIDNGKLGDLMRKLE